MINDKDYKAIAKATSFLDLILLNKLKKDILISVTIEGKRRYEYIFNLLVEDASPRVTLFLGNPGLISFADLNYNGGKDALISPFELSYLDIEYKDEKNLTAYEEETLKRNNKRITAKANKLINYFERGKLNPSLRPKDLANITDIVEVLEGVFRSKEELKKISEGEMFLLYLNQKDYVYSFFKTEANMFLPRVEYFKPSANKEIIKDLSLLARTDKRMHLTLAYTSNFTHKDYPLLILSYGEINKGFSNVGLVDTKKEDVKKIIWSYLISMFEEYGLPSELEINDLEIESFLEKTLKSLKVEAIYTRLDSFINSYIDDLQLSLFSFNENALISNHESLELFDDFLKQANSFISMLIDEGYNPVEQKIVDDLKELYDLILNYTNPDDELLEDLENPLNNLVS